VLILTLVNKSFSKEREMIIKQLNFKERKKALQIAPKRSAVIPTLQKDTPRYSQLHKKIRRYCTKVLHGLFPLFERLPPKVT